MDSTDEIAAMEAVMEQVDPATVPGLPSSERCALGRFSKPITDVARQAEMFRELARKVHGSFANKWAEGDAAKTLIRTFESITAEEAIDLVRALKPHVAFGDSAKDRLTRLMQKLEEEGRYTDANTCWLALEAMED